MDNKKIIIPTTQSKPSQEITHPEASTICQVPATDPIKVEPTQTPKAAKDAPVKKPAKQEAKVINNQEISKTPHTQQVPKSPQADKTPLSPIISQSQQIPNTSPIAPPAPIPQIQTKPSETSPTTSQPPVVASQVKEIPTIEPKVAALISPGTLNSSPIIQQTQSFISQESQIKADSQSKNTTENAKVPVKPSATETIKSEQVPQTSDILTPTKMDAKTQQEQSQTGANIPATSEIKAIPIVPTTLENKEVKQPEQVSKAETTSPTTTTSPTNTITPPSDDTNDNNKQGKKSKKDTKPQKKEQPTGAKEPIKKEIEPKPASKESENVKIVKNEPKLEEAQKVIAEKQTLEKPSTAAEVIKSLSPDKVNKNTATTANKKSTTPEKSNKSAQNDKKLNSGKKETIEKQEKITEKKVTENLTDNKNDKKVANIEKTDTTEKQTKIEKPINESLAENKIQQDISASTEIPKNQQIIEKETNKEKVTPPATGTQKKGTPVKKPPEQKPTPKPSVKVETKKPENKPKQASPAKSASAPPAPSTKQASKSPAKSTTPTKSPEKQLKSAPIAVQQKSTEANHPNTPPKSTGKQPSPPNKQAKTAAATPANATKSS